MDKPLNVLFPAPLPAEIPCPVCAREEGKRGNGCLACSFEGKLEITVDAKIPIQRAHIIKYISDNMEDVSSELTRMYGLVPKVNTKEVYQTTYGTWEIVQVSSLGGAIWIANRVDLLEPPMYFYTLSNLKEWMENNG